MKARVIAMGLVVIGSLRIVATYTELSHTIDEPSHIACGMEWIEKGVYQYEAQHPPLARVATAILPWVAGARPAGMRLMWDEGAVMLFRSGNYEGMLALARLGILPFFWLGAAVVYLWAERARDGLSGVFATLVYTLLPPVLAHAGLATTDMALAGTLAAAVFTFVLLADDPGMGRGLLFGMCVALTVLSKFSSIAFLPPCLIAAVWLWRPEWRRMAMPLGAGLGVAAVLVWAGYRFSWGMGPNAGFPIPAPELYEGLHAVVAHHRVGHPSYLMGRLSDTGFWYYYPAALLFKTPLAVWVLAVAGWRMRTREGRLAVLCFAAVLGLAMVSRINIGVRHVLPLYLFLAVSGGLGLRELIGAGWKRYAGPALVAWLAVTSVWAHPDYIAYFNELAGSKPERILVDSDLDWGQDTGRLQRRLSELGVKRVAFDPFVISYTEHAPGFPEIVPLDMRGPAPGWNAVSLSVLKLRLGKQYPNRRLWPDRMEPQERIGKGILLYQREATGPGGY